MGSFAREAAPDRAARRPACRGRRPAAGGRHAQGDGDARLPRGHRPPAEPRACSPTCCGPSRSRALALARCGARSRRCAARSAKGGSARDRLARRAGARRRVRSTSPSSAGVAADPDAGSTTCAPACALHRDDLLAGFALRDSVEFEDWLRERAGHRTARARRPARPARPTRSPTRTPRRGGRPPSRAARARPAARAHAPAADRRCTPRAGRRGDALGQYRECVRALDRELGVAPLSETTELYNAISGGNPTDTARRPGPAAPDDGAAARRARP